MKTISLDQLQSAVGTEVGVSPWRVVSQTMIDQFADATDDHQFIHVDPERAARETPFGGTIAHGFLLLSLLSAMTFETLPPLEGSGMGINHGFDKMRFQAPVKSGARIRARFFLADVNARPSGWVQVSYDVTIEIENSLKPALTARWLTLTRWSRGKRTHERRQRARRGGARPLPRAACAGLCRTRGHRKVQRRPVEPDLSAQGRERPLRAARQAAGAVAASRRTRSTASSAS